MQEKSVRPFQSSSFWFSLNPSFSPCVSFLHAQSSLQDRGGYSYRFWNINLLWPPLSRGFSFNFQSLWSFERYPLPHHINKSKVFSLCSSWLALHGLRSPREKKCLIILGFPYYGPFFQEAISPVLPALICLSFF